jgi:hypothetical protein
LGEPTLDKDALFVIVAIVGLLVWVPDEAKLSALCFLVVFNQYWAGLHPHGGGVESARGWLSPLAMVLLMSCSTIAESYRLLALCLLLWWS